VVTGTAQRHRDTDMKDEQVSNTVAAAAAESVSDNVSSSLQSSSETESSIMSVGNLQIMQVDEQQLVSEIWGERKLASDNDEKNPGVIEDDHAEALTLKRTRQMHPQEPHP
jgi:hypothetical protein